MAQRRYWTNFWDLVTRSAAPLALCVMVLAVALAVIFSQSTRSLGQCIDRWAAQYVAASSERDAAHDATQTALDALIRAVPTTDTPTGAATFDHALSVYIAASNAARQAEKLHPLPPAPALDC